MVSLEDLKLPPNNIEAERGVLGGVFLDNEVLYIYDGVDLKPDDFYQKEHQHIYKAILLLKEKHKTIDVVTVADELDKMKVLDSIGGNDYLFELSTSLITISSCGDYSKIVKEKSILRNILKVCQRISGDVYDQEDTIKILDKIEQRIFDLTQTNIGDGLLHIKEILDKRVEEYVEIVDNPGILEERKVLSTYSKLDKNLGGFKQGELLILAARPSMGKTAFALNLLMNIATQGKSVAFFSLEMTAQNIVDRVLSTLATIPMHKISQGTLDHEDFAKMGEAIEKIGDYNIFIDDSGSLSIPELKSKLRRLKIEKGGLDFVVIDYLQLMNGTGFKYEGNRVQEISQISRGLKELSKDLMVPILALSQLSRVVETRMDKKPQLSDLRESGAIEQDADVVMMLYREDYYDPDTDKKGVTDILIRKNRNGPTGEVELMFKSQIMKFVEISDEDKSLMSNDDNIF